MVTGRVYVGSEGLKNGLKLMHSLESGSTCLNLHCLRPCEGDGAHNLDVCVVEHLSGQNGLYSKSTFEVITLVWAGSVLVLFTEGFLHD